MSSNEKNNTKDEFNSSHPRITFQTNMTKQSIDRMTFDERMRRIREIWGVNQPENEGKREVG